MASIRGFVIALVVSLVTMVGSGIAGNPGGLGALGEGLRAEG